MNDRVTLRPRDVRCRWCDAPMGAPCVDVVGELAVDDHGRPTYHASRVVDLRVMTEPVHDERGEVVGEEPLRLPCPDCYRDHTGEPPPDDRRLWPDRLAIDTFVVDERRDPTAAYRLQCGHSTIDL